MLNKLDFGNALLVGFPAYLIRRLQAVQNASARLIHRLRRFDSDVNKDLTLKAKAKDSGFKAKAKDSAVKAKAKAKDSAFKAKAKAKDRTYEGLNRELDIKSWGYMLLKFTAAVNSIKRYYNCHCHNVLPCNTKT